MTATWSVNKKIFLQNAITVKNNQPLMAVVKNNAYHYDLEFAVTQFIHAGIDTFPRFIQSSHNIILLFTIPVSL